MATALTKEHREPARAGQRASKSRTESQQELDRDPARAAQRGSKSSTESQQEQHREPGHSATRVADGACRCIPMAALECMNCVVEN